MRDSSRLSACAATLRENGMRFSRYSTLHMLAQGRFYVRNALSEVYRCNPKQHLKTNGDSDLKVMRGK
jgi:hypothetical protein